MKTFQQFNEDVGELQKLQGNLETLQKKSAPMERLLAKRREARERSQIAAAKFANTEEEKMKKMKEKQDQLAQEYEQKQKEYQERQEQGDT
jgi:hypothetical protein